MRHRSGFRIGLWSIAAALAAAPGVAAGHGMIPMDTPVERLIANLTKFVQAHPDDAEGFYRLGRVHTMALETQTEFVPFPH